MVYTVEQLVTNAYYLSGKNSQNFNEPTGNDLQSGVTFLNEVLAVKTANNRLIPYYSEYNFLAITNEQTPTPPDYETRYFIPNLISIETFVFYIGTVRYASTKQTRRKYQGSGRAEQIQSLQFSWYMERSTGGGTLFTYFSPSQDYPLRIWGKFSLNSVTFNQNLLFDKDTNPTGLDMFYITYLKYALAEWICQQFNITMQPQASQKLKELETMIVDIAPLDMTTMKRSTLQSENTPNWAWVNLSQGWNP